MKKNLLFAFLVCTLTGLFAQNNYNGITINTRSDLNSITSYISLNLLLQQDISQVPFEEKYLLPLTNYLDYNVIGLGNTIQLDIDSLSSYIIQRIDEKIDYTIIGHEIVEEIIKGNFKLHSGIKNNDFKKTRIGGYLVGEFEYHQEPDGNYIPLMEINQFRLFFSSEITNTEENKINVLAEWNPVPEEVVHHIEQIEYTQDSLNDNVFLGEPKGEGLLNFERLFFKIENINGSNIDLTYGQIRSPFGLWSDYSSHRNFSSTKNNLLVNGFALKKIELGARIDANLENGLTLTSAIVHGRMGRTSPLFRADNDDKFDLILKADKKIGKINFGASAYLAEFEFNKRIALGIHYSIPVSSDLLISGEFVYQQNNNPEDTYMSPVSINNHDGNVINSNWTGNINKISSTAAYIQFDYAINDKIHFYGMYDIWALNINEDILNAPAFKAFNGIRYYLGNSARWTIIEYGRMFHNDFDKGYDHISTQIEITF